MPILRNRCQNPSTHAKVVFFNIVYLRNMLSDKTHLLLSKPRHILIGLATVPDPWSNGFVPFQQPESANNPTNPPSTMNALLFTDQGNGFEYLNVTLLE